MSKSSLPRVLDSKTVLQNHVQAKLMELIHLPCGVDDLVIEICDQRNNQDILKLLVDDNLLRNAILDVKDHGKTKQRLGEELFYNVSSLESSLCAQITGMLLELDVFTIYDLLNDSSKLERAVTKAKEKYLEFKKRSNKDLIGEELYDRVLQRHPDSELAARLTGMLLELDLSVLQTLLEDIEEFNARLNIAFAAANSTTKCKFYVFSQTRVKFIVTRMSQNMASEEQKQLAAYIKNVHLGLRLQARTLGPDQAWLQHCQNTEILEKYASNMQLLATEYWAKNSENLSRIQWVVQECINYFHSKGHENALAKEEKLCLHYLNSSKQNLMEEVSSIKLLDVGSCYNPFVKFQNFEVTALDLMPATPDVVKCDFLSVEISNKVKTIDNPCSYLPDKYFNVVVFSLLLEYFPSSKQRLKCCRNAYELLKPSGLLFILTPDSKHATANSKMMKSWRFALASLGFWRISYQKMKHLHCMAFRKCFNPQVTKVWLSKQNFELTPEELFYIPQDFHEYCEYSKEVIHSRSEEDNEDVANIFNSLPQFDMSM